MVDVLLVLAAGIAAPAYPVGKVVFPVSCTAEAGVEFERSVALLHHMTYPQAKLGFEKTAAIDPKCAMAHWGIAMTLFQPLWPTRPGAKELSEGAEEVRKAEALTPATEREKMFVAAAAAFFREPGGKDYWARIRRWEAGMEALYGRFPEDPEVKAFFALSLLSIAQTSSDPLPYHNRAADLLLSIQEENPIHPGSIHYLIHANDIPGREHDSLDIVREYGEIAPRNPHALHMPTHIYTRLGRWDDVIAGNLDAALAALEHPAGEKGEYVWDEFPHAIEYLVYAYLQKGDDAAAAAQLTRLLAVQNLHPTSKTAFHLSSIPARYALEREAWEEAAALMPRPYASLDWDRFPWPEAVTWFAKGLGSAHRGKVEEARRAADRLAVLEKVAGSAGETLFEKQIRILRLAVTAQAAHAAGKDEAAVRTMTEAAELDAATPKPPVTPATTIPAYELLGDLHAELGKAKEALSAYERCLAINPHRFRSVLGAARAAAALEEGEKARERYAELLGFAAPSSKRAGVEEARRALATKAREREAAPPPPQ